VSDTRPLARTDGVLTETLDGELLVYDLDGDIASHLNRTAALVWRSCDGHHTVAELLTIVVEELGETADEDVVLMALDSLTEHGLISSGYEERGGAAVALSRRRFFRRFGVAGAAALNAPVVYSMVVPTAAAALSNGGAQPNNNSQQFNQPLPSNQPSPSNPVYP
jgi:hypothetical protein